MDNSIEIFKNEEFGEIRSIEIGDDIFFVATDICRALDIDRTATRRLDNDEKGVHPIHTLGGVQNLTVVNEYGLYNLVMSSRKPIAKDFKRWITHEVIPSIRKTGGYTVKELTEIDKNNAEAALLNARVAVADRFIDLSKNGAMPVEYKCVLEIYAANTLAGETILALPPVDRKTYSATEIGNMLGVLANKIGRLANANNLKTEQYDKYFYDKAKNSNKEIETFRYYDNIVEVFRNLLR